MGLDQPFYIQFILYVNHLLHGDLGTSWQTTRPVLEDLIQRFPATLELVTFSLILAIAVGMGLGHCLSAESEGLDGQAHRHLRPERWRASRTSGSRSC